MKTTPKMRRWIAAATVTLAAVGGVAYAADSHFGHHGGGMGDPAMMAMHMAHLLDHVLPNGTPEQKAALHAIAKSAMEDLKPLHKELHDGHKQMLAVLTAQTIDSAAAEALRLRQMQALDAASKRILKAAEDAAQVLTPEQRTAFAEQLAMRMH